MLRTCTGDSTITVCILESKSAAVSTCHARNGMGAARALQLPKGVCHNTVGSDFTYTKSRVSFKLVAPQHCPDRPLQCRTAAHLNQTPTLTHYDSRCTLPKHHFLPRTAMPCNIIIELHRPPAFKNGMTPITVQVGLGVVFFLVELQLQGCPPGWKGCLGCQAVAGALMTSLRLGAQSWGWAPLLDPSTCLRGVCSAWNSVHHCWFGCRQ